jgi:hypothetical protein
MKFGRSIDSTDGSKWWYIAHDSKDGNYRSIVFGWDGVAERWFLDVNEIDLILISRKKFSFNWRYLLRGCNMLRGN